MFDLHRHDEYSTFDGFGKASELAKLAKELGYTCYSQLTEKINNIELIDGKLYRWV